MSARGLAPLVMAALLTLPAAASADVQLTIQNGRVTLNARNATVREILAEWARVGRIRILNGERVPGGPITIQLTDVPEGRALEVVLRSVSGYMAAPRRVATEGASTFERILVLPTSAPPRQAAAAPTPARQPRAFPGGFNQQPQFNPQFPPAGDFPADDDPDGPRPVNVIPNPGAAGANQQQQPSPDAPPPPEPQFQAVPGLAPGGVPVGVAAPGMLVPQAKPGAPGQQPSPNVPPNNPQ